MVRADHGVGQATEQAVQRAGLELGEFDDVVGLSRRLPKRGFKNPFRREYVEVNLGRLQAAIDAGRIDPAQPIDVDQLRAAGLLRRPLDGVRLLAEGELTSAIRIKAAGATQVNLLTTARREP